MAVNNPVAKPVDLDKRGKGAKKGHRGWGTIRKLPSGKFQASYIGKDLCRHNAPGTFDNRLNAEGWLANEKNYLVS